MIIAGDTETIEAQFTDPANDMPVNSETKTVRYEPPAAVTALFCRYGKTACGPSVLLTNVGYGHYRGSLSLTDAGSWSLQVLADWGRDEMPNRQALVENAVTVRRLLPAATGIAT